MLSNFKWLGVKKGDECAMMIIKMIVAGAALALLTQMPQSSSALPTNRADKDHAYSFGIEQPRFECRAQLLAQREDGAPVTPPGQGFRRRWRNGGNGEGDSQPPVGGPPFDGQRLRAEKSDEAQTGDGQKGGRQQFGEGGPGFRDGRHFSDGQGFRGGPHRPPAGSFGGGGGLFGRKPLDLSSLNLSDDQKQRIKDIHGKNGQQSRDFRKKLQAQRSEFKQMMFDPQATDDQIRARRRSLRQMQDKMEEMQLNDFLAIRSVLSPEQRQRLADTNKPGPQFAGLPGQGAQPPAPVGAVEPASPPNR